MAMKRNGKSPASSESDESVMFFRDVSLGPHETRLRFRLIHFWEAQNPVKKTLIGLEMLLIDEQVNLGELSFKDSSHQVVLRNTCLR
ncbi:BnaAnng27810D [Brassica napus]|uniref:BnaA01g29100D protein n=1 Tax=Brassica napus TaxID=3708 RepID=A0A078JM78_BRANA|nr:BnaA01g29100D [Brassica napus]CDY68613.1 BnaAnng27810D [Brassica napus]